MRENLTYGLMWQGVETSTSCQAPLPDPTSRRAQARAIMPPRHAAHSARWADERSNRERT